MEIKTNMNNLVLRSYLLSDAEDYSKLASNKNIWNLMRDEFPYPFNKDKATKTIEKIIDTKIIAFVIEYKNNFVGDIHITQQIDILRHSCMLGYWLGEPYWNLGIMSNAVNTMVNYCFETLSYKRIFAKVFANNYGSIKVLEKSGFVKEGHFKNAVIKENKYIDQIQYSIFND
ncbi:MAG: GNAT family protein [Clostridiales bacterium]